MDSLNSFVKLSEIIPVYNKAETCSQLNKKVESIPIQKQITVVDEYPLMIQFCSYVKPTGRSYYK